MARCDIASCLNPASNSSFCEARLDENTQAKMRSILVFEKVRAIIWRSASRIIPFRQCDEQSQYPTSPALSYSKFPGLTPIPPTNSPSYSTALIKPSLLPSSIHHKNTSCIRAGNFCRQKLRDRRLIQNIYQSTYIARFKISECYLAHYFIPLPCIQCCIYLIRLTYQLVLATESLIHH